jgi:hypothetical protein
VTRHLAIAALAAAVLAAPGCGGGGGGGKTVRVEGTEYAYVMPDTVDGGVVRMEFASVGTQPHEYAMGRLLPGKTLADFRRELSDGDESGPASSTDVGGVPLLSAGRQVTITRALEPGTYVLVCFVPAPDGKTHFQHGMVRTFEVEGDSGADLPDADGTIVAEDDRYEVPELEAGTRTIELRNAASSEREFNLVRIKPGKTLGDAETWFRAGQKGTAPLDFLGAMQSIPSATSVFLTVDLDTDGQYVVFEGEHNFRATLSVTSS